MPLSILALAVAAQANQKELAAALALTPEHFAETAEIKDDDLETVATISTLPGYQRKRGLMKVLWDDNFLRAFIDKSTGKTTFQVYQIIPYSGRFRRYQTVNFETPAGPRSIPATTIDQSVDGCSRYGCSYTEHVGFDVDEDVLRAAAAAYRPGVAAAWRFKFKAQSGDEWQDGILGAEIVGLLTVVDAYRSRFHSAQ
jgi:hypothetical protein